MLRMLGTPEPFAKYTTTEAADARIKVIEEERERIHDARQELLKPSDAIAETCRKAREAYDEAREEMLSELGLGYPKRGEGRAPASFLKQIGKLIGVENTEVFADLREKNAGRWRDPIVVQLFNQLRNKTPDSAKIAALKAKAIKLEKEQAAEERKIKSSKAYGELSQQEHNAYREIRHCREEIDRLRRAAKNKAAREALKNEDSNELNLTKVRKQLRDMLKAADAGTMKWPPET